jgi:DNA invertase Pin-like site-specific DNA recombinase
MARIIRAIGYVRDGVGGPVDDQVRLVTTAVKDRGWRLLDLIEESVGVGPGLDRPELHRALTLLSEGEAHVLIVSSIDRLAPSLRDLAVLFRWFEAAAGPKLISVGGHGIDAIDTTTRQGQGFATALIHLGEWEHSLASIRAQEALLARRVAGHPISRPAVADNEKLGALVKGLRKEGRTLQQIADLLNAHNVPTRRRGALWRPSSLQTVLGYRRKPAERPPVLPPPRPAPPDAA